MSAADNFKTFLSNLVVSNTDVISGRYGELTAALNKQFRDTESKTANSLQVGSFGRKTAIDGVSDLDMLYLMPAGKWDDYSNGGQRKLLEDARDAISARYPKTPVNVDRLVVTVRYGDFHMEVQPVFEQDDGSFIFPDTKDGGRWRTTKPRPEMDAIAELDLKKNANLRRLCKMTRAWKNKHGVEMGGLLIDTLAYNFLDSTTDFDEASFASCGAMTRDFFLYLSEEPEQERYDAPGSKQHVRVKKAFQRKARKAYDLCVKALETGANARWKKVFGRPFPADAAITESAASSQSWRNTEEHIEDRYPVDIRYDLQIDCEVKQSGFRTHRLREMLAKRMHLSPRKDLTFSVLSHDIPEPFSLEWKVLNRGEEAHRRDCVRGQIHLDDGHREKHESTTFKGDHVVDCYAIKDGVVVAKTRIEVPIDSNL